MNPRAPVTVSDPKRMREECMQKPSTANSSSQPQSLSSSVPPESHYPYDAWILAGGRLFRAHSQILGAHSPYLRASISTLAEPRLLLPHIPAAGFGAILSYMYTGRLALTQAPIYEILITAHLLQMPAIAALCQTILASSVPYSSPPTGFLASSSEDSPEKITLGGSYANRPLPKALSAWQSLAQLVPTPTKKLCEHDTNTSTIIRPTPTRPIMILQTADTETRSLPKVQYSNIHKYGLFQAFKSNENLLIRPEASSGRMTAESNPLNPSAVVLDIAACDGPVFFERVVNKAFKAGNENEGESSSNSDSSDSEINVVDTADSEPLFDGKNALSSFKNQLQPNFPNSGGGSRVYHCVYCNNNFKSHYCYQKHMRRHINPITVEQTESVVRPTESAVMPTAEEDKTASDTIASKRRKSCTKTESETTTINKNPTDSTANGNESGTESHSSSNSGSETSTKLKVLDLNVQYFPCKTCGSKFPSYYFVHKHRRICHREEEILERGKSAPGTPNSSLSCDSTTNSKSSASKGGQHSFGKDGQEEKTNN